MAPGSEENEEPPALGTMPSQKKRPRTLDSVISTLTERKSSKYADPGGMALPVFRSDPDGDVLISCVDWNCNCKFALHSRMAFRGQSYRRIGGAGRKMNNGTGGGGSSTASVDQKKTTVGAQNDIKEFAEYFKRRRFELGYTQKDVAAALADEYRDIEYTQPSIAKFEHLHFSPNRLSQMRNRLQKWLDEAERLKTNSDPPVVMVVNGHSQSEPLNVIDDKQP
ncbi:Pou domain - to homeobox domain protein [Trichinella nativa]|uniref:Pou domain-to homeobox domain protein n=1 Tax=Trichinella nativa TaxID=6335 RepID=A0A1Y3EY74_9BILA|nr:Pou domain - to homeobox domain protein [Trichinella nativa]